jgi:hypothetical protein
LLETAIGIVGWIRDAHGRQKDLARVLDSHHRGLTNTKAIIQIAGVEEALRTATVGKKLADCL